MSSVVFDKVRTIASDVLGVPVKEIGPDTSPATVASWDSVQHLNLVLAIEQAFDLMFEPEELDRMKNVQQIADLVGQKHRGPA